jgi:hypothetical protein
MKTSNVKNPAVVIGLGVAFVLAGLYAAAWTIADFDYVSQRAIPIYVHAAILIPIGVIFVVQGIRARRQRS